MLAGASCPNSPTRNGFAHALSSKAGRGPNAATFPLAGATIAGIVVVGVAFLHSVPAGIVAAIFIVVYQQLENHFLQPVIYGRTVQLSPLTVLVSVLFGAELSGVIGALAAIPVAGAIQVIVRDQLDHRQKPSYANE